MGNDIDRAWDWFRNIVALAQGAEEHAKEAEREACCFSLVNPDDSRPAYLDWESARDGVFKHIDKTRRYADAAKRYRQQIQALAESTGDDSVAGHLRNSEYHITRAEKAQACARAAIDAVLKMITDKTAVHIACQTTNL